MKGTLIAVLILVSLVYSSHNIDKPWHTYTWTKNNSYIISYGSNEFWEANILQLSLDSLKLSELSQLPYPDDALKVETYLQIARQSREDALQLKDRCNNEISAAYYTHFFQVLGSPTLGLTNIIMNKLLTNKFFSFSEVPSCLAYGSAWKGTMDSAMGSLEESMMLEEKAYEKAETALDTLFYSGVCQEDYPGETRNQCEELRDGWQEVEEKEEKLAEQLEEIKLENQKSLPNEAEYVASMKLLWQENGLMDLLALIEFNANAMLLQAEQDYTLLLNGANQIEQSVASRIDELEDEQLGLIASSPFVIGTIETGNERNVQKAWEEILANKGEMDQQLKEAQQIHAFEQQDYLLDSSLLLQQTLQDYSQLLARMEALEENAKQVTQEMHDEAEIQIAILNAVKEKRAIGSDAEAALAKAESALAKGDSQSTIGSAYVAYREAVRQATIALSYAQGYSLEQQAAFEAYEKSIGQLLAGAERDSIDVLLEKSEFRLVKGHREQWALEILENIEQSILGKAQAKYEYLESKRRQLFVVLNLGAFDLIKREVLAIEGDSFENGRIDYKQAIGNLKTIDEAYNNAESQLAELKDDVITARLEKSVSWLVEKLKLDEPATIEVDMLVYNPTNLKTENFAVQLSVPKAFQLTYADIASGQSYIKQITQNGDTLTLYFITLDSKKRYNLIFEKQKVLAHTLDRKIKTYGMPDGSAEVEEKINFEMDYEHALAYDKKGITIDGLTYRGRALAVGEHTLESKYGIENAFSLWQDDHHVSSLGITKRLEYTIFIKPTIDLDRTQLFLAQDSEVSNFKILSVTGERILNKQFLGNGMMSLELGPLRADKTASFQVSMDINDAQSFVENQLRMLDNAQSSEVQDLISQARFALQQNQTELALEKVQQAQYASEKEQKDLAKAQQKYDELASAIKDEIAALEEAIATSSSHEILEKLKIRKQLLENALKIRSDETIVQAVDRLKQLDENWSKKELSKLVKESFDEYNKIKAQFLSSGENLSDPAISRFEQQLRTLEISNSLEDLSEFLESYENLQQLAEEKTHTTTAEQEQIRNEFTQLKPLLQEKLNSYSSMKKQAKDSNLESWFSEDEEEIKKLLKEAETALKKGEVFALSEKLILLKEQYQRLDSILSTLKNETERKLENAENVFNEKKSQLSEQDRAKFNERIAKMQELADKGEYVKALKLYDSLIKSLPEAQTEENNMLIILGITAILILALLIGYMVKQMREGQGLQPSRKWRKLARVEDKPGKNGNGLKEENHEEKMEKNHEEKTKAEPDFTLPKHI